MGLPNLSVPEFKTTLPSTNKTVTYRPFLVKEEKILLIALEGGTKEEVLSAVMRILGNCVLDEDFDINKISTFDVEHLFLQIRGKSVGELLRFRVMHKEGECKSKTDIEIKIDDIKPNKKVGDGIVLLEDKLGIKFRYPSINEVAFSKDKTENVLELILGCVEYVFDEREVYKDFTKAELSSWFEKLNKAQWSKVKEFFSTIPKLSCKVDWTCKSCGKHDQVTFEGLQSFFVSA
jgi:hypothetical protein